MKSIWRTELNGKTVYFKSNLTNALLDTEKELGVQIEPTGLSDDKFGSGIMYGAEGLHFESLSDFREYAKSHGS